MHDGDEIRWWARDASDEHVRARRELADAERALREQAEQVAELRRALPPGPDVSDAELTVAGPEGERRVRLAELFGEHRTLLVYHMMFGPDDDAGCTMCGMWLDGLHGVAHHLRRHTAVATVGAAPQARLQEWAHRRGWDGLDVASSHGTTFGSRMAFERDGEQLPGFAVFVRDGAEVTHASTVQAFFPPDGAGRGIDPYCAVWPLLDLLPAGRGDWWADTEDYLPQRVACSSPVSVDGR